MIPNVVILAVFGLILLALAVVLVLLSRTRRSTDTQSLALFQQQLEALRQQTTEALSQSAQSTNRQLTDLSGQLGQRLEALDRRMESNTSLVGQRLDSATRIVQTVSTTLGELTQASRQIFEVGKDIASLQDILRAPKLRGEIGELFLEDLLRQVIPNHYDVQHQFRSGEKVDAVVRLGPKLVPIDSKFPLENFKRMLAAETDAERKTARRQFTQDVRKHVDAIASKYIRPDEGTFDFALMYILAENVYYETVIRPTTDEESIGAYAISRRVIPVSPNSLYAYLQAIVLGLRGFQIEKRAEEILEHLGRLEKDFDRFREEFDVLGNHLKNARNKYDDAAKRLSVLEDRLAISVEQDALPTEGHR